MLRHGYHTHIKRRAYDGGYAAAHALDGRRSDEAPLHPIQQIPLLLLELLSGIPPLSRTHFPSLKLSTSENLMPTFESDLYCSNEAHMLCIGLRPHRRARRELQGR